MSDDTTTTDAIAALVAATGITPEAAAFIIQTAKQASEEKP